MCTFNYHSDIFNIKIIKLHCGGLITGLVKFKVARYLGVYKSSRKNLFFFPSVLNFRILNQSGSYFLAVS